MVLFASTQTERKKSDREKRRKEGRDEVRKWSKQSPEFMKEGLLHMVAWYLLPQKTEELQVCTEATEILYKKYFYKDIYLATVQSQTDATPVIKRWDQGLLFLNSWCYLPHFYI
jgi:hypothetical protein